MIRNLIRGKKTKKNGDSCGEKNEEDRAELNTQFADAAIAATAIINKAKLATLNKKDFQRIKELELV